MGNQNKTVQCPQCYTYVTEESRFCHKCGLSLDKQQKTLTYTPPLEEFIKDTLHFDPGESFGNRYRIIEEIGRGGMGRVYKAEDKELNINVALKMIRPEYSSNPRFIQKFKEETLLARSISHENVIRIHDIGDVDDIKFISMDYIRGQSLKELIHTSGTLAVETTTKITEQLCRGLEAAHKKGVVHQDLKPRNIMIDSDGKAYIMDFGVAKSLAADETRPSKGIIGTPPYLSPEQAKKEKIDQRSDIYSLGIIIYEMLTGKRPFESDTFAGYIEKHIHERPPSPSDTNPLIPPFLERIILKCLEKDKTKRYQNVEMILKDMEAYEETSMVISTQPRVHKLWKLAFFIPLVAIIILGIFLLIRKTKTRLPSPYESGRIPIAVMYFENNTGDENLDHWRSTLADLLTSDLAQSRHLRVLPQDTLFQLLKKMNQEESKRYSTDIIDEIASQIGTRYFILASYTKEAENFRINLKVREAYSQEFVGTKIFRGERLITLVDELTPEIKSMLDISRYDIASDFDKDIGKIITDNPEAYKYYWLGEQYYKEGKYERSNEALQEAIKIDEKFAIAYKRISENYHYMHKFDLAKEYAHKALSMTDRVSVRNRYLIEGWVNTILEDSYEKAIETYKEMLEYYPDDIDGNIYLGSIYRNMEEWDLAAERFNKILKVSPVIACENLVSFNMAKGLYEEAKNILQANKENYFNMILFHSDLSLLYLCQNRFDIALLEIEKALAIAPENFQSLRLLGMIHETKNDFESAEKIYRTLIQRDDLHPKIGGHLWLAYLNLTRGQYELSAHEITQGISLCEKNDLKLSKLRFLKFLAYLNLRRNRLDQAIEALEEAEETALETYVTEDLIFILTLSGIIQIKMNKVSEAKDTAQELRQLIQRTRGRKYMRYNHHLMGMIALEENKTSQAIEEFEKAVSLLPQQHYIYDEHAFFLYPSALAYYQHGDLEKALNQLEKIVSLSTGRLMWGDIYAKSFYWLGKIYQEKRWIGKAIENYEMFLKLWNDADPDLTEIDEAKRQLETFFNASIK